MPDFSDKVDAALISAAGVIIGALLAAAVGWMTGWIGRLNTRHTALVTFVTNERATWRKDLREAVAGLSVNVMLYAENATTKRLAMIEKDRVAIRLRLNPKRNKRHMLDVIILDSLLELRIALRDRRHCCASILMEGIERAAQQVLKGEWEKSKQEAKHGRLTEAAHPSEDTAIFGTPILCCEHRPPLTFQRHVAKVQTS